ncbi:MAG: SDR family NAD(P)-dependent oxidoreductase, partial [Acidobacteriota bacterium]
ALMLEVVSEKTGYPQEMLGMEMELEADLGIDSIKRVEILSEVSAKAPGMPEVDTSVMATLVTVGQVVDYMDGLLGGTGAASAAGVAPAMTEAQPSPEPSVPKQLGRFVLEAVERPPLGMAQEGLFGQGVLWVTNDGTGLAEQLIERLSAHGVDAVLTEATSAPANLRGVIDLSGLRDVSSEDEAISVARQAFKTARSAAQRLAHLDGESGLYVTVQDTGGRFGLTEHGLHREWLAGLASLARTAGLEWPGVAAKAVDLERGSRRPAELADALIAELFAGGPETEVGLSEDGVRFALVDRLREAPSGDLALSPGQVVVATGGARGVTAATLVELAGAASLKFALLGRSELEEEPSCCHGVDGDASLKKAPLADAQARGEALTPADLGRRVGKILATREIHETLKAIQSAGSEACYLSADVADPDALDASLDAVRQRWGGVHALVHGAGVLADKEIELKSDDQFDRVFDTKVAGLRALLDATKADELSALVLFSSVAARCGNVGQSDYAMANETLGKVAHAESRRRGDRCVVKTLGWGPWEGGMVTPSLKAHFETMGVPLIPLAVGARMLVDELRSSPRQEVELVLGGEPVPAALAPQDAPRTSRVDVVVGRSSHSYLRDHAIEGTPVVPVALVIEWFARAAGAFAPHLSLQALHDVEVVRGVSLAAFESADTRLVVRCEQLSNGQGLIAGLELSDGEGRLHYRAKAELVESPEAPRTESAEVLDLEEWGARAVYATDGVLFHGPGFQMIERVEGISDGGVIADLHGVAKTTWGAQPAAPWRTDPVALDGGLQLALLWADRVLGGATLPTSIGRVQFGGVAPSVGSLRASLRGVSAEGSKTVSDVDFVDESGAVVARMEGVVTHLLPSRGSAVAGG